MDQENSQANPAYLHIAPRALAEALHLPEGTTIDCAEWDLRGGFLRVRVNHPDLPPHTEGLPLPPVNVIITTHHDATTPDRVARTYTSEWSK